MNKHEESIKQLSGRADKAQARLTAIGDEVSLLEKELGQARLRGASTSKINARLSELATEQRETQAECAAVLDAISDERAAMKREAQETAAAEYARLAAELVPAGVEVWQTLDALHQKFCEMAPLYHALHDAKIAAGNLAQVNPCIIHPLSIDDAWSAVAGSMKAIVAFQGAEWLTMNGLGEMPDLEGEYKQLYPIAPRVFAVKE